MQQERACQGLVVLLETGKLSSRTLETVHYLTSPSVTNAAGGAGGSVSNYGNGIKDATGASGARTQTAQNPTGLSSNKYGGKKVVTGAGGKGGSSGSKGSASNPLGLS